MQAKENSEVKKDGEIKGGGRKHNEQGEGQEGVERNRGEIIKVRITVNGRPWQQKKMNRCEAKVEKQRWHGRGEVGG